MRILVALAALALIPAFADARATSFVTNVDLPFTATFLIPCEGPGDVVEVTGEVHLLVHVTIDDTGGMHADTHTNPHGTTGVSAVTGALYHAVGSFSATAQSNGPTSQLEMSMESVFDLIGEGQAGDLVTFVNTHVTVNSNGDVTASVTEVRIDCR